MSLMWYVQTSPNHAWLLCDISSLHHLKTCLTWLRLLLFVLLSRFVLQFPR